MSWNPSLEPGCPDAVGADAIETLIVPRARDIGGFEVRRALPAPKRQMVGPFIFFDQAGPAEFLRGQGVDVRPHPHIGLATVTYLYQRRVPAPRQPRLEPDHPSWRAELDGRRTRRHPFRAHERRDATGPAQPVRHPDLGRPARGAGGRARRLRTPRQGALPPIEAMACGCG